jgi:hypothetical protein
MMDNVCCGVAPKHLQTFKDTTDNLSISKVAKEK